MGGPFHGELAAAKTNKYLYVVQWILHQTVSVMDGQQKHIRIFHWKNNLHFGESPSRGKIYSATYLTMYRHFVTPSVVNGHISNN